MESQNTGDLHHHDAAHNLDNDRVPNPQARAFLMCARCKAYFKWDKCMVLVLHEISELSDRKKIKRATACRDTLPSREKELK